MKGGWILSGCIRGDESHEYCQQGLVERPLPVHVVHNIIGGGKTRFDIVMNVSDPGAPSHAQQALCFLFALKLLRADRFLLASPW